MKFNKLDKLILIDGYMLLAEFVKEAVKDKDLEVVVFASKRHLAEKIYGQSLKKRLAGSKVVFYESADINNDKKFKQEVTKNSLGIAMGAPWIFSKKTVKFFAKNHLLDYMGVDLPRYRGGAHHTWRILHQNNLGVLNMQVITGSAAEFQKGKIIKREEFNFPAGTIKPLDCYNFMIKKEINFLKDFIKQAKEGQSFELTGLKEEASSFYPFLSTKNSGLINWHWLGREIYLFINAFDDPYPGASTYLNKRRIFLKDCQLLDEREKYHPFTSGIVIRKDKKGIYVAGLDNLLLIKKALNEQGKNITDSIQLGDRLHTPYSKLDEAMTFRAIYDDRGLKNKKK